MAPREHPAFSPQKLKARLHDAASEPVAFAFGIDKSGKEPVLLMHDKLEGKPLLQFLKNKTGAVELGTFGMAKLDGKRLYLYAEKNMKSLLKLCKLWVAKNKHPMITKIIPVVGGVELSDGEEETALEDAGNMPPKNTKEEAIRERRQNLGDSLKAVLKRASSKIEPSKLKAVGKEAISAIETGDFALAKKIIEALAAASNTGNKPSLDNSIEFGKLAESWISARQKAERDVASLRAAATKAYPHLSDPLSILEHTFKPFNRELGRTLKAASASKNPEQTGKLAKRAATIALEYQTALRVDPLVAHLKKNPFKTIDLLTQLSTPLANVLAAIR